jgi:hypothetical protein
MPLTSKKSAYLVFEPHQVEEHLLISGVLQREVVVDPFSFQTLGPSCNLRSRVCPSNHEQHLRTRRCLRPGAKPCRLKASI